MKTMRERFLVVSLPLWGWLFTPLELAIGLYPRGKWLFITMISGALTGCSLPTANSQQPIYPIGTANYQLLHTIEGNIKNFTTDNLQNVYVLTQANEVIKYTPGGIEQFRYPNKTLGNISGMDATNPFHILLFFPDFQQVLMLDRTLNITGQFNLFRLGLFQVPAVCMASDNKLWLYDEVSFRLKKVTQGGNADIESNDLSLATGRSIHPNFMTEREQSVFVNDPDMGILVFDVFGQHLKTLDIKGLNSFQILDGQLIYFKQGRLAAFHLQSLLEQPLLLPEQLSSVQKVRVEKERLYVLEKEGLKVFRY